jgi:hypothetical protein
VQAEALVDLSWLYNGAPVIALYYINF